MMNGTTIGISVGAVVVALILIAVALILILRRYGLHTAFIQRRSKLYLRVVIVSYLRTTIEVYGGGCDYVSDIP